MTPNKRAYETVDAVLAALPDDMELRLFLSPIFGHCAEIMITSEQFPDIYSGEGTTYQLAAAAALRTWQTSERANQ